MKKIIYNENGEESKPFFAGSATLSYSQFPNEIGTLKFKDIEPLEGYETDKLFLQPQSEVVLTILIKKGDDLIKRDYDCKYPRGAYKIMHTKEELTIKPENNYEDKVEFMRDGELFEKFVGDKVDIILTEGYRSPAEKKVVGDYGNDARKFRLSLERINHALPSKIYTKEGKYTHGKTPTGLDDLVAFAKRLGSEDMYIEWTQKQKCVIKNCGVKDDDGVEKCEAAHVRKVSTGAGMAIKPEYCLIPLHPKIHRIQHEKGISHLHKQAGYKGFYGKQYPIYSAEEDAEEYFVHLAKENLINWIWHRIKEKRKISSMSEISLPMLLDFLQEIDYNYYSKFFEVYLED